MNAEKHIVKYTLLLNKSNEVTFYTKIFTYICIDGRQYFLQITYHLVDNPILFTL